MADTQTSLLVRCVEPADFDAWLPHWKSYQKFYKVDLPNEVTMKTWKRFFDSNEPVFCAVAIHETEMIGFTTYLFHRSTWAISNYCYLEDLFVSPESRGKHVGKQLIEYVHNQAQNQHCARLYWHTQECNHVAQRLYDWIGEKPGFIEYRKPLK